LDRSWQSLGGHVQKHGQRGQWDKIAPKRARALSVTLGVALRVVVATLTLVPPERKRDRKKIENHVCAIGLLNDTPHAWLATKT